MSKRDIVDHLDRLSDAQFEATYEDFRPLEFVESFVAHDAHHQDQIDGALARLKQK
ncbi:hypothetical protein OVA29_05025 [Exiguobacterium sp. SL14]|nr:hypothetical protein [Exiguobacterium sp. SL14]MCY1690231.1 hypothetical protein [Exiguobacterium sp. SL14]